MRFPHQKNMGMLVLARINADWRKMHLGMEWVFDLLQDK